jgi:hypothetical protein
VTRAIDASASIGKSVESVFEITILYVCFYFEFRKKCTFLY